MLEITKEMQPSVMTEAEKIRQWQLHGEKAFHNWCRRQKRKAQARFENEQVIPVSKLGFSDVEECVEAVVSRLEGKV